MKIVLDENAPRGIAVAVTPPDEDGERQIVVVKNIGGRMIRVTGRWSARVEQDFEIEVENESEIAGAIAEQMNPRNVVELLDFEHEIETQEVVENDEVVL